MVEISIITCVYNTKKEYLQKCLESVFKNTFKNFEVIMVDDGSTTNYDDIVKQFDVKYYKTKNQGLLSARMFGFGKANGKYVYFVDSDDLISFNYLEPMLKKAKKEKCDIVFNDWASYAGSNIFLIKYDPILKSNFCFKDQNVLPFYFSKEGKFHSYYVVWNKLYKHSLLKKAFEKIKKLNLNNLVYCEDVLLNFYAHLFAKKVCNVHCGLYFYRIHEGQETNTKTQAQLERQIKAASFVFKTIENEISKTKIYENIKENFLNWKNFLSYNQNTIAKSNKFYNLKQTILDEYQTKIKRPKLSALISYQQPLPINAFEVFEVLEKAYLACDKKKPARIFCKKNSLLWVQAKESEKHLNNFNIVFEKNKKNAEFLIKEKTGIIRKIINLTPVSFIGQLVFPKGSNMRLALKRKLMGTKK